METIIIISLLVIIIFLLLEKKTISKDQSGNKVRPTSILGSIKSISRQLQPIDDKESHPQNAADKPHTFISETITEAFDETDVKKELTEILVERNDWQEEEEEAFYFQNNSNWESGFATGVTFQELNTAGQLLQQEWLEPVLQKQAVEVIQKIQGTELFTLLENSLDNASRKIAFLLQQSDIENEVDSGKKNEDVDGFDIGEFV